MMEDVAFRLYRAGIQEELRSMRITWEEMKDNPDSPLKDAAKRYLDELQKEHDRLHEMEMEQTLEAVRGVW